MKTLRDKAVTNQSHCRTQRTVKDISGQSSHALVRRGRPVTANSHAALFTLRSRRKALCSCYFLFHLIPVLQFPPRSLFHFCHCLVMLHPACGDQTEGRGQHWYERTGGCVLLRLVKWRLSQSGLLLSQKQTPTPNTRTSTQQTQHANVSISTGTTWRQPNSFFFPLSSFFAHFIQFCCSPHFFILFLFHYLPLFHTPSLLQWPSADLTRAVYYWRMS